VFTQSLVTNQKRNQKYGWSKPMMRNFSISKNLMTAPRILSNLMTLEKSTQKNSIHKNGALFFS
jgi:hypothetical protein